MITPLSLNVSPDLGDNHQADSRGLITLGDKIGKVDPIFRATYINSPALGEK